MISTAVRILLGLLLALLLVVLLLPATETGTRWLLEQVQRLEPRLSFRVTAGTLWRGLVLDELRWQDGELQLSIPRLEAAWQPNCLWQGRACLDHIRAAQVDLKLPPSAPPAAEPPPPTPSLQLPVLPLPFELRLAELAVDQFNLRQGETTQQLRNLALSARWQATQLTIQRLAAEHDLLSLHSAGTLQLTANYPLELRSELTLRLPQLPEPWPVTLQLSQDLARLALTLEGQAPLALTLQGVLPALDLSQPSHLELRWQTLQWPLAATPQLISRNGTLVLDGQPDNYALTLDAQLQAAQQPPIQLHASANGDLDTLQLHRLRARLLERNGELRLSGRLPLRLQQAAELALSWQDLAWPLRGTPQLRSPSGTLQVRGVPEHYAFTLDARLATPDGVTVRLDAQADGNLEQLRLQRLIARQGEGQARLQGQLNWRDGLRWQAQGELAQLDLNPLLPPSWRAQLQPGPLPLTGRLDSAGHWRQRLQQLQLAIQPLSARYQQQPPLILRGNIRFDPTRQWQIPQLTLQQGDNRLAVNGTVGERWGLAGELQLVDGSALPLPLSGRAQGTFQLSGALRQPDLQLALTLDQLQWQRYRLQQADLQASIRQLGLAESRLDLRASGAQLGPQRIERLQLTLQGTQARHQASLQLQGEPTALQLQLTGQWQANQWQARLLQADVSAWQERWQLEAPLQLTLEPRLQRLTLSPHCWRQQRASLCLNEPLQAARAAGRASLSLQDYDLQRLQTWLPPELEWLGTLSAELALNWQAGQTPRLQLAASSRNGQLLLKPGTEQPELPYDYRALTLDAKLNAAGADLLLTIDSDRLGQTELALQLAPSAPYAIRRSRLQLRQLPLAPLRPLLPQLSELRGQINVDGRLAGTLRQPDFFGTVSLSEGRIVERQGGLTIDAIELQLAAKGKQATLTGSFQGGAGRGELSGRADWRNPARWNAQLALQGRALEWSYQPWAKVRMEPDLRLEATPERLRIDGEVIIPYARIKLRDLPQGAVSVSEDAVIVDLQQPPPTTARRMQTELDVRLVLGRDVRFRGQGARGRLTGSVRLRQRPPRGLEANGEIIIAEGRYKAYGQNLTIRQGAVLFAGPISQPALDVEAIRRVGDVTAGLQLSGRLQNPRIELFSEPPLQQEEILAYLVLGRPLNPTSEEEGQQVSGAATALGLVGGSRLAQDITEQLGIEDFEITTERDDDDTRITVGGRIGSRLYLKYGVGQLTPVNKLTVRYYLTEQIYMEAVSALESALDIFYEFDF